MHYAEAVPKEFRDDIVRVARNCELGQQLKQLVGWLRNQRVPPSSQLAQTGWRRRRCQIPNHRDRERRPARYEEADPVARAEERSPARARSSLLPEVAVPTMVVALDIVHRWVRVPGGIGCPCVDWSRCRNALVFVTRIGQGSTTTFPTVWPVSTAAIACRALARLKLSQTYGPRSPYLITSVIFSKASVAYFTPAPPSTSAVAGSALEITFIGSLGTGVMSRNG